MAAFGTITLKGNAVDDVATADTLVLPVLGMQAVALPEEVKSQTTTGVYQHAVKYRLVLTVVVEPFNVDPSAVHPDARTYFRLMRLLGKKHKWISAISSELLRYTEATMGLIVGGVITLPYKVGVMSYGDLSADFAKGVDGLTIKFCSMSWIDIPVIP